MKVVEVGNIKIGGNNPLVLVAGPCVIESEEHLLTLAHKIKSITSKLSIPYILKTSFDKANRTSIDSYRGPGLKKGLEILSKVKKELDVPVLTDVHEVNQVEQVAQVADIIQIPAFLCRQTDLICKVADTKKPINIKKGQFLAPEDIKSVIEKVEHCGNQNIILTERGVTFGYHNLVVDMRSFVIMRNFGYPVMFDATHSLQLPGGLGASSGGQREFIPHLTRAAVAVGIDSLFLEIHDNPSQAMCDGTNMLCLSDLSNLLDQIIKIHQIIKEH